MKHQINIAVSIITVCLFLYTGCSDDGKDTKADTCIPSCTENTAVLCLSDGSKEEKICEYGCDGNACASETARCSAANEVYNTDTQECVCDSQNHWKGTSGDCQCIEGYVPNSSGDACEPIKCDENKEYFNVSTGSCVCNSDHQWEGTAGNCQCIIGYKPNDDNNACVQIKCDENKELLDEDLNDCVCNIDNYWEGTAGSCHCIKGYELNNSKEKCVPVQCDLVRETYNEAENTCICRTDNHWEGERHHCSCAQGYVEMGGTCVDSKKCTSDIFNYNQENNICVCKDDASLIFGEKCVSAGDMVVFGKYKQSSDAEIKDIEWIVMEIDKENHRMLLLSKYILDIKPYHQEYASVAWKTSSLRSWLNGYDSDLSDSFINTAFDENEIIRIAEVEIKTSANPYYSTVGGGDNTKDKIFLLDYEEVNRYYPETESRKAYSTPYADIIGKNSLLYPYSCVDGFCDSVWWLRTPGNSNYTVMVVTDTGNYSSSYPVNRYDGPGVRPALWMQL